MSPPVRRYDSCGASNSAVSVKLHSATNTSALVGWTVSGLPQAAHVVVTCYGFGDDVRHRTIAFPVAVQQATVTNLKESTTYMACVTVVRCTRLVSCTHFTTSRRAVIVTSGPTAQTVKASWSRMYVIGAILALAVLLLVAIVVMCALLVRRRRQRRHKRPVTVVTAAGGTCGVTSRMRLNSLQRAVQHGVVVDDNQYESIPAEGRSLQRLHKFAPVDTNTTYVANCACGMAAKYGVPCDCATQSQSTDACIYDGDGYLEPVSLATHPAGPRRFTKPGCPDDAVTDALLKPDRAALKEQLTRTIADRETRANPSLNAGPARHYKNVSPYPPQLPPRDIPQSRPTSPLSPHIYSAVDESAMS